MYKILFFQFFFLICLGNLVSAQKIAQTAPEKQLVDLIPNSLLSISSGHVGGAGHVHEHENAGQHNIVSQHDEHQENEEQDLISTTRENSPWWQTQFDERAQLHSIQLEYQAEDYPTGLSRFYIFMSNYPMEHSDFYALLSSPAVEHIYVEGEVASGASISLGKRTARYLRVQSAKPTQFNFSEVKIMGIKGLEEIPNNNIDDDFDGYVDNKDKDLFPVFRSVVAVGASCATCNDATIHIVAGGENLSLSLDGGVTFSPLQGNSVSVPVEEGAYQLVLSSSNGTTVDYPKNPVKVSASPDMISNCGNGNFDNGFVGWTGGQGTAGGVGFNDPNIISSPRQVIIPSLSGTNDPNVSAIPLVSPSGQSQFARLGTTDLFGNLDYIQRLRFSFVVDPTNFNFSFNHAFVGVMHLPSGGGTPNPSEQSYFNWKVETAGGSVIATETINTLNAPSKFTVMDPNSPTGVLVLSYSNWAKECVNLSEYMGQTVTVSFITRSCSYGYHGGYAYIDGLCQETERIDVMAVNGPNTMCINQGPVNITAGQTLPTASPITSYTWSVEKIDANGVTIPGTRAIGVTTSQLYNLTNFLDFWSNKTGQKPQCGDVFKTTLSYVDANCAWGDASVITTIECGPDLSYCNIAICSNAQVVVQPQGTGTNCADCVYEWFPKQNLSDPYIGTPNITVLANTNATYKVSATAVNGCISSTTLQIARIAQGTLTAQTVCVDKCNSLLEAYYTTTGLFDPMLATVSAVSYNGPYVNTSLTFYYNSFTVLANGAKRYKFISNPFENKGLGPQGNTPEDFTVKINVVATDFCVVGSCPTEVSITHSVPRGIFQNVPNVYIPNAFSPNAPNPADQRFNPWFSLGVTAPGVYWTKMNIYDQWGALIYSNTSSIDDLSCATTQGLVGNEGSFPWDGTRASTGKKMSPGVYTYTILVQNCTWSVPQLFEGSVTLVN